MDFRCKYCLIKSTEKLIQKLELNYYYRNRLVNLLFQEVSKDENSRLAPEVAADLHRLIRKETGIEDICFEEKDICNRVAENYYQRLKILVESEDNSFDMALRISIAGNIMDMAAVPDFMDKTSERMNDVLNSVMNAGLEVDDSKKLFKKIQNANTILILGDNCGEIVFDRLFIETLNKKDVYYAVKSRPVINDATIEDAVSVGLDKICTVISNGYDAPSTLLENCSEEFLGIYKKADLIISKGQGNLEGLLNENDERLFFLLMVKCPVIADTLEVPVKSFIVMNSGSRRINNHKFAGT